MLTEDESKLLLSCVSTACCGGCPVSITVPRCDLLFTTVTDPGSTSHDEAYDNEVTVYYVLDRGARVCHLANMADWIEQSKMAAMQAVTTSTVQ